MFLILKNNETIYMDDVTFKNYQYFNECQMVWKDVDDLFFFFKKSTFQRRTVHRN